MSLLTLGSMHYRHAECMLKNYARLSQVIQFRSYNIKYVKAKSPVDQYAFERARRLKRHVAPHLKVYKPQLTSVLSITHRICGTALSGYCCFLGLYPLTGCQFEQLASTIQGWEFSGLTLLIARFVIALPFCLHMGGGLRHLIWDSGNMLSLKGIYASGYALLVAAFVGAALLAWLGNRTKSQDFTGKMDANDDDDDEAGFYRENECR